MSDPTTDDTTVVDTPTDAVEVTPVDPTDGGVDSTAATPSDGETVVPGDVTASPFDSGLGATSTDSEPDTASSGSEASDGSQPESDLLTGGTYDGTEGNTAGGPDVAPTPGYDGDIAPSKDGTSPDQNQPTIEQLGGPGVDPTVSLSPTDQGLPSGLDVDDEPVDTTPVITQPEDAVTPDGLEPTFVTQSTLQVGVAGRTPQFVGNKLGSVISVRKVGWIGPESLDVHEDSIDELIGLLTELKGA